MLGHKGCYTYGQTSLTWAKTHFLACHVGIIYSPYIQQTLIGSSCILKISARLWDLRNYLIGFAWMPLASSFMIQPIVPLWSLWNFSLASRLGSHLLLPCIKCSHEQAPSPAKTLCQQNGNVRKEENIVLSSQSYTRWCTAQRQMVWCWQHIIQSGFKFC